MIDALKRWMWAPAMLLVAACGGEPDVGKVDAPSEGPESIGDSMPVDSDASDEVEPTLDDVTERIPPAGGAPTADAAAVSDQPAGPEPKEETAADHPNLRIKTLVEGEGDALEKGQTAKVHYVGFLLDGTQFDGNVGRAEPFAVQNVGNARVIKGWNLGLIGMKKGEKRRLTIPPDLAYGATPRPKIPANSTLVFDVTLDEIVAAETPSKD